MVDLVQVLNSMPPKGLRLNNGLALHLTSGNGMAVLGCSRIDAAPTDDEMKLVGQAVWKLFTPSILLKDEKIEYRFNGGCEHHIRRLYWPLENVGVVQTQHHQQALLI